MKQSARAQIWSTYEMDGWLTWPQVIDAGKSELKIFFVFACFLLSFLFEVVLHCSCKFNAQNVLSELGSIQNTFRLSTYTWGRKNAK